MFSDFGSEGLMKYVGNRALKRSSWADQKKARTLQVLHSQKDEILGTKLSLGELAAEKSIL